MNDSIFFFLYNFAHQSQTLDNIVIFTAVYFPYIVVLLAALFLLFHHEVLTAGHPFAELKIKWKEITSAFLSGVFAWFLAAILKILIHAPRPTLALPDIHSLFPETGFSFPSGHATFFMALAVSIFLSHKKAGYWFIFFALLIGVARIIAGVHFPVDILGGFILGSLVAYFAKKI